MCDVEAALGRIAGRVTEWMQPRAAADTVGFLTGLDPTGGVPVDKPGGGSRPNVLSRAYGLVPVGIASADATGSSIFSRPNDVLRRYLAREGFAAVVTTSLCPTDMSDEDGDDGGGGYGMTDDDPASGGGGGRRWGDWDGDENAADDVGGAQNGGTMFAASKRYGNALLRWTAAQAVLIRQSFGPEGAVTAASLSTCNGIRAKRPRGEVSAFTRLVRDTFSVRRLAALQRDYPYLQACSVNATKRRVGASSAPSTALLVARRRQACVERVHQVCALWLRLRQLAQPDELRQQGGRPTCRPSGHARTPRSYTEHLVAKLRDHAAPPASSDKGQATPSGAAAAPRDRIAELPCARQRILVVVRCSGAPERAGVSRGGVGGTSRSQAATARRIARSKLPSQAPLPPTSASVGSDVIEERELVALVRELVTLQDFLRAEDAGQPQPTAAARISGIHVSVLIIPQFTCGTGSDVLFFRRMERAVGRYCCLRLLTTASQAAPRRPQVSAPMPSQPLVHEGEGGDTHSAQTLRFLCLLRESYARRGAGAWPARDAEGVEPLSLATTFTSSSPIFFFRPANLGCAVVLHETLRQYPVLLTPPQWEYVLRAWTCTHAVRNLCAALQNVLRAGLHVRQSRPPLVAVGPVGEVAGDVAVPSTFPGGQKMNCTTRLLTTLRHVANTLGRGAADALPSTEMREAQAVFFCVLLGEVIHQRADVVAHLPVVAACLRETAEAVRATHWPGVPPEPSADGQVVGGDRGDAAGPAGVAAVTESLRWLLPLFHHTGMEDCVLVAGGRRASLVFFDPSWAAKRVERRGHDTWPLLLLQRQSLRGALGHWLQLLLASPQHAVRRLTERFAVACGVEPGQALLHEFLDGLGGVGRAMRVVRADAVAAGRQPPVVPLAAFDLPVVPVDFYAPQVPLSHRILYVLTQYGCSVPNAPHGPRGGLPAAPPLPPPPSRSRRVVARPCGDDACPPRVVRSEPHLPAGNVIDAAGGKGGDPDDDDDDDDGEEEVDPPLLGEPGVGPLRLAVDPRRGGRSAWMPLSLLQRICMERRMTVHGGQRYHRDPSHSLAAFHVEETDSDDDDDGETDDDDPDRAEAFLRALEEQRLARRIELNIVAHVARSLLLPPPS